MIIIVKSCALREKVATETVGPKIQDGCGKLFAAPTCHMKFFLFLPYWWREKRARGREQIVYSSADEYLTVVIENET